MYDWYKVHLSSVGGRRKHQWTSESIVHSVEHRPLTVKRSIFHIRALSIFPLLHSIHFDFVTLITKNKQEKL